MKNKLIDFTKKNAKNVIGNKVVDTAIQLTEETTGQGRIKAGGNLTKALVSSMTEQFTSMATKKVAWIFTIIIIIISLIFIIIFLNVGGFGVNLGLIISFVIGVVLIMFVWNRQKKLVRYVTQEVDNITETVVNTAVDKAEEIFFSNNDNGSKE